MKRFVTCSKLPFCVAANSIFINRKVLNAVHIGLKELYSRFDALETSLRETLRKTSSDLKANTAELESLSAIMRQSHHCEPQDHSMRSASAPHNDHQSEMKQDEAPTSQDLLRRLKRGYLLQYECEDEDENDGTRPVVRPVDFYTMLKREVILKILSPGFPLSPSNFHSSQLYLLYQSPLPCITRFHTPFAGVRHLRGRYEERN
jgi:hypothetical protein